MIHLSDDFIFWDLLRNIIFCLEEARAKEDRPRSWRVAW